MKQNGQPTEAWIPDRMEAIDATGNEADFPIIDSASTNGVISYDAKGTSLSPSEVWRLRMRFRREKDFAPDRIWTSPDLPGRNGRLFHANLTTNLASCQLTVLCSGQGNSISAKLYPKPKDARLRLVGIEDNRGNRLEHLGGSFGDYEFDGQWKISPGAESVKIKIGLIETALPALCAGHHSRVDALRLNERGPRSGCTVRSSKTFA